MARKPLPLSPAPWLRAALLCTSVLISAPAPASANRASIPVDTGTTGEVPAAGAVRTSGSFDEELARVDATIDSIERLVRANKRSWLHLERLASARLDRARLSGNATDYRAALDAIDRAFALSGDKAGPFLTRAGINVAVHRFDQAMSDLDIAGNALLVDQATALRIKGLRADALMQTENHVEAGAIYQQLNASAPSMISAVRMAHWHSAQSDYQAAEQWLEVASERFLGTSAYALGWMQLQRGIVHLEQQQLDEAHHYFTMANETFPGYWLIEEHVAEVDTLQGRLEQAEVSYRDIVARTGLPQMMIALADVLEARDAASHETEIASLRDQSQSLIDAAEQDLPGLMTDH